MRLPFLPDTAVAALFLQAAFGIGKGAHTQELTILDGLNGVLKPVRRSRSLEQMLSSTLYPNRNTHNLQGLTAGLDSTQWRR